jgi:L-fuculose-phosphate aldolase
MKIPKYEKKLRKLVKKTAKRLGKRGFTSATRSSVSLRMDGDRYLVTPKGVYLRKMKKKMVLTIDAAGHPIYGRYGWQPSDDLPLHMAVYQARGDVNGVIHAHPPYLSALALAVDKLDAQALPDSLQVLGQAVRAEELDPVNGDVPAGLLNALTNGDVILLPGNGVLIVSRALDQAFATLDQMEHDAQVYAVAKSAGLLS